MTDIEIARSVSKKNIIEIANVLSITSSFLELYGNDKAKIDLSILSTLSDRSNGKLILVTSIHPTPYGEGKTTVSIGIQDALRSLGKNSLAVLREPSLGPVFGVKGGATGGGHAQVIPMEDINLHFTGDIHAVTAANNLLCAIIDNHLFQGNELHLNPSTIAFFRVLDMNDRALRNVDLLGNKNSNRSDNFMITTASEMMAILCLSENLDDLKKRLGNIFIGFNDEEKPIFARDLGCVDALAILLKDAIKPNLVQTLENNPVLIHGGPFANIAHGCNSIIATKLGLKLSDYVVTEAGFGSDLGALKFFDIKCRTSGIKPDVVVINATIRSLKYNGGCPKEEISKESLEYLEKGSCNLIRHVENMRKFQKNIIVCLNHFYTDTSLEVDFIRNLCEKIDCPFEVCDSYLKGSVGSLDLGKKIIELCSKEEEFHLLYTLDDSIFCKIEKICKDIYRASDITYSDTALSKIRLLEEHHLDHLPICIAKTQYSFSDNPSLLGAPTDFSMNVMDVELRNGAGFIVVKMGGIVTMPGLSKNPAYLHMSIDQNEKIDGLF